MSALLATFESRTLAGVAVAIDACDQEAGANLAMILAEFGAHVRLRGANRRRLEELHTAITGQWGRAEIAAAGRVASEAAIRIFGSAADAAGHLATAKDADTAYEILLVTRSGPRDESLQRALKMRGSERPAHVLFAATSDSSVAALVTFLLSPAGAQLPNQCFELGGCREEAPRAMPPWPSARPP